MRSQVPKVLDQPELGRDRPRELSLPDLAYQRRELKRRIARDAVEAVVGFSQQTLGELARLVERGGWVVVGVLLRPTRDRLEERKLRQQEAEVQALGAGRAPLS